ncbi:DMT family transporter [Ancylobacter sp. 6x-1]|uniref:DMT family transporter n=1 Tax=Ancylobacter crimeensis TaxID=2579147 RepID=A0ABT0D898_9HYPH|nr:DMT family transporter [Ancylobacter crimeensis]MCK0196144.1 DMT family transporter [Ancylobacter crimeensis]
MSPPPPASLALTDTIDIPAPAASAALAAELLQAKLRRRAFGGVLAAALCIGFSAIFVRLSDVGPAAVGFWRLVFALGPTALWALAEWRGMKAHARVTGLDAPKLPLATVGLSCLIGLFFAVDLVLFNAALQFTTTANAVLLGNMAPLFVMLMGWAFLGERPTRALFTAMALAIAGALLIMSHGLQGGQGGAATRTGDLMCLVAASAYSAYILFIRMIRRAGADGRAAIGGGMLSLISTAFAAVLCLGWAVGTGEMLVPRSLQGLLAVAGLGIVTHAAGQGLTTFALGRLPAGLVSVVLLLQILVGVGFAALLFGEIPSLVVIAGGALVVAGVLVVRPRAPRVVR